MCYTYLMCYTWCVVACLRDTLLYVTCNSDIKDFRQLGKHLLKWMIW